MLGTGLIIGRFQPFHNGHLFLLQEAFKFVKQAVIGIGSINIHDSDNPYSQKQVEKMLYDVLVFEKLEKKVVQIFGIPDFNNDEKWLSYITANSKPYEVVISHNDWVTRIFKAAKIPVREISFYKRELYEGKKIRNLMKRHINISSRIPPVIYEKNRELFGR